jgi:hypothetical protein
MLKAQHNDLEFVIEEDHPNVGAYLYVYQGGKCVRDFLQNDEAMCIEIAFENYGVPRELWSEIGDEDNCEIRRPAF